MFKTRNPSGKRATLFWSTGGAVVLVAIWELLSRWVASPILLPSPLPTLRVLVAFLGTEAFLKALASSFLRVLAAILISVPLGVGVGIGAGMDARFRSFIKPLFSLISATPVLAVILIAFLWFGQERTPIFTAFLMIFPVMVANTIEGIQNADRGLKEMMEVYGFSSLATIRHLYLPSLLPFLGAGLRSSLSLSWKVVVAAEVLVQPLRGLGTGMQAAKAQLETTELFAWTAATVLAAALTEGIFDILRSYRQRL